MASALLNFRSLLPREIFVSKPVRFLILATMVIAQTANADMENIVSGGSSCTSQGSWTQNALKQAGAIVETVQNLASDPNCGEFAKSIGALGADAQSFKDEASPSADPSGKATRAENMMVELQSLRTVLENN